MLRVIAASVAFLVAALVVTLALPVPIWRTGDQGLMPLESAPERATPRFSRRLWIDTDAACGHGRRTDPDDCFALALLARAHGFDIVGISTVAGNAPRATVDRTTRELAARLAKKTGRALRVHSGPAALADALNDGPLTILALGPLTNVAAALGERPERAVNISRLVAVMGRRPGHLFHPSEGAGAGMLFGHGPVFRDFNFALDPQAAAKILELDIALSLVPYDAARGIELTVADLDRLLAAHPWLVERSREWLAYWRRDIGRAGFYPFDLLAAGYIVEPGWFRCTPVHARVAGDSAMLVPWRPQALLVEPSAQGPVLYCARPRAGTKARLVTRLAEANEG